MTDMFKYVEVADGRVWMRPEGVVCFAGDLPEQEQKLVWATHYAPAADLFTRNAPGVAWKAKPSWYIVATKTERFSLIFNASWQSEWVQPRTQLIAATSRCCPTPPSSSTLSALPQKLFKHHPLRREAVAAVTAESKPYLLRLWSSLGVVLLD